jgi:hypothetical protein
LEAAQAEISVAVKGSKSCFSQKIDLLRRKAAQKLKTILDLTHSTF